MFARQQPTALSKVNFAEKRQRKDLLIQSLGEGFMVVVAEPERSVILVDHDRFRAKREHLKRY